MTVLGKCHYNDRLISYIWYLFSDICQYRCQCRKFVNDFKKVLLKEKALPLIVPNPSTGRPQYLKFLKPLMAIRSDRSGFSYLRPVTLHISLRTRKTQPRRWKKRRKEQTQAWVSSKRKREVCDIFTALRAFTGYRGRVFARNIHKAIRNADSFPRIGQLGLCRSTGLSSHFSDFCSSFFSALLSSPWLTCSVDWYLLLSVSFWFPLSTDSLCLLWDLPSLIHLRLAGDLAPKPFVWVSRQNRQSNSLTGTHTHRNGCHP